MCLCVRHLPPRSGDGGGPLAPEKIANQRGERFRSLELRQVPGSLDGRELRTANRALPGEAICRGHDHVALARHDERRHVDSREALRDPGVWDRPQELCGCAEIEQLFDVRVELVAT